MFRSKSKNGMTSGMEFTSMIRRLNEHNARLTSLQKEKSDPLHRVLEHVTEVHSLCNMLGEDFIAIVNEVHPGLHGTTDPGKPTSISDSTLGSLAQLREGYQGGEGTRAAWNGSLSIGGGIDKPGCGAAHANVQSPIFFWSQKLALSFRKCDFWWLLFAGCCELDVVVLFLACLVS